MEGTRQEHILGTCGKETFCGKEQEGEKGSEAGREDKNGGERSGEKEGGERGALQRLGSPWSPVPAGVEFFSTLSWGLGTQRPRRRREWRSPARACFITLDSARSEASGVEPLWGGGGTDWCPETDPPGRAEAQGSPTRGSG